MANNTYTLKVAIDQAGLKGMLGSGQKEAPKSQSMFSKFFGGSGGKLLKGVAVLGIISAATMGIFSLVKKIASMSISASPMLQAMLKVLNTGIMFILRPIGDFFGFFLRPLVIYFLRNIALPFYREFMPLARNWGKWLSAPLVTLLFGEQKNQTPEEIAAETAANQAAHGDTVTATYDMSGNAQNFVDEINKLLGIDSGGNVASALSMQIAIDSFVQDFKDKLAPTIAAWEKNQLQHQADMLRLQTGFIEFINGVIYWLSALGSTILKLRAVLLPAFLAIEKLFVGFGEAWGKAIASTLKFFIDVGRQITEGIIPAWNNVVKFFTDIGKDVTGTIALLWEQFTGFFQSLIDFIKPILKLFGIDIGEDENKKEETSNSITATGRGERGNVTNNVNISIHAPDGATAKDIMDSADDAMYNALAKLGQ